MAEARVREGRIDCGIHGQHSDRVGAGGYPPRRRPPNRVTAPETAVTGLPAKVRRIHGNHEEIAAAWERSNAKGESTPPKPDQGGMWFVWALAGASGRRV